MSLFLLPEDVARLTGFVRASSQLAWCKENGVQAYLSAKGEVVIPVCAITGRAPENDEAWTPDFTVLRGQG